MFKERPGITKQRGGDHFHSGRADILSIPKFLGQGGEKKRREKANVKRKVKQNGGGGKQCGGVPVDADGTNG